MNALLKNMMMIYCCLAACYASAAELKFITLEVAPWAYYDQQEKRVFKGIFPDIVDELEKHTGHKIKITLTPYARVNKELKAGRQDCTMLIRDTAREEIIVLGGFVFDHPMGVIPKKGINLNSYDDLYGLRLSVLRALHLTDQFGLDEKLHKEYDTDYEMGLRKMNHGRLDAIAGAIPTIQYLAKVNGVGDLLGQPLVMSEEPIYLQCSKKSLHLHHMPEFNKALEVIRDNGVLQEILNKY